MISFSGMDFVMGEKDTIRSDMKAIRDQMRGADDIPKKQLQASSYLVKNQQINEFIHETPPKDFVTEWKVLDLQEMDLIEQQFVAKNELESSSSLSEHEKVAKQEEIKERDLKIMEIRAQIEKLQSEAVEFMRMDPGTERQFEKHVFELHQQYDGSDSAFVMAGIDYEQEKIIVELTAQFDDTVEFEMSSVAMAEKIRDIVGAENVLVTVDTMELTACTNYADTCRPLVGGVAIARADDPSNLSGSIGYKATKDGTVGYVTAGHVVDFRNTGNRAMLQPLDGSQISDGTGYPFTKNRASGDVSFQSTSVGITDDIYYSSNTKIDVSSYATDSSQHNGQFVYKMGAGGGRTWGYVHQHFSITDVWRTSASAGGGDSGGPIFNIVGYSNGQYNGKLFGHMYSIIAGNAVYQPTEKIIANHGIYPATT